jgi:hypothetical protein
VKSRMPTRLDNGEGRAGQGSNRHEHLFRSAGVVGTARRKGGSGNRGRPVLDGGCGSNAVFGRRSGRESDRVMVPLRPGNAGGGKGPDFWRAFDDGEDR